MKTRLISEKGQYLAQFVLLLPLLIGFMGLVVDVGNAYRVSGGCRMPPTPRPLRAAWCSIARARWS